MFSQCQYLSRISRPAQSMGAKSPRCLHCSWYCVELFFYCTNASIWPVSEETGNRFLLPFLYHFYIFTTFFFNSFSILFICPSYRSLPLPSFLSFTWNQFNHPRSSFSLSFSDLFMLFSFPFAFICPSHHYSSPCISATAEDNLGFPRVTPTYPNNHASGLSWLWQEMTIVYMNQLPLCLKESNIFCSLFCLLHYGGVSKIY